MRQRTGRIRIEAPPKKWKPLGKVVCQRCGDYFLRPMELPAETPATRCRACLVAEIERELEIKAADAPRLKPAPLRGVDVIRDDRIT